MDITREKFVLGKMLELEINLVEIDNELSKNKSDLIIAESLECTLKFNRNFLQKENIIVRLDEFKHTDEQLKILTKKIADIKKVIHRLQSFMDVQEQTLEFYQKEMENIDENQNILQFGNIQ